MKALTDYPTPLTDAARADSIGYFSCSTVTADHARDLERKLAMCRDALIATLDGCCATIPSSVVTQISAALDATK